MRKFFLKSAVAIAATVGAASSAHAFLFLNLIDVNNGVNKACDSSQAISATNCNGFIGLDGTGAFIAAGVGQVLDTLGAKGLTFGGTVGDFQITTNFNTNLPGTATSGDFNESSTRVARVGALGGVTNNFVVSSIAFGYNFPTGVERFFTGSAGFSSSSFGGDNPIVNTQQGLDTANLGNFAGAGVTSNSKILDATAGTGAQVNGASVSNDWVFPTQIANFANALDPYSLASVQTYTLRVGTIINATSNMAVTPVSAPSSVALAGLALLAAGVALRRRAA